MFVPLIIAYLLSVICYGGEANPIGRRQRDDCLSRVQRRSWTALSRDDKLAYINAERCLQATPAQYGIPGARVIWDELQYVHVRQSSFIHGVGAFLPWHRYYVKLHEILLQRHCGFNGGVPYWNEAADAYNVLASSIWAADTGMGGDGTGPKRCVSSGPFSNLTLIITNGALASVGEPYCLSRAITPQDFLDTDQQHIDECFAITTYWEAMSCYGNAPHWGGHAGTGGVMEDAMLAPGDPMFFLHHTNLDRLYWAWQQAQPARLTEIGGPNIPSGEFSTANGWPAPGPEFTQYSGDGGQETTLNHILWMAGMISNATIASVLDLHGGTICAEYV